MGRKLGAAGGEYCLTRFLLLRLLGSVYLVAFWVAVRQLPALIGADGLTPVGLFFERVVTHYGGTWEAFREMPSVFWLNHSDAALLAVAWLGVVLSAVVVLGYANGVMLLVLWASYLSIVHVGQEWYGYGWEIQLPETGFLAVFLVPLWDGRPWTQRSPPILVIWLYRWLLFRVMFGAGMIKLRGDDAWADLTALYYHFETQPIPNALSRWYHFLPRWILQSGVLFNHAVELVMPWLLFGPRRIRHGAGIAIVVFHLLIISSGNLSFLNWLTLVPAVACFDDRFWGRICPPLGRRREQVQPVPSRFMMGAGGVLACVVVALSLAPARNLMLPGQRMNSSFNAPKLVNTYGNFGSVGRERYTVVFEGTTAARLDHQTEWIAYPYWALPVALDEIPPQIAPYQPHFDWQMWFAAMGTYQRYPWTLNLVWKLLHNDPTAVRLFGDNPFASEPPRYVRAVLYRYEFVPATRESQRIWDRTPVDLWLPPLSRNSPALVDFLRVHGWIESR